LSSLVNIDCLRMNRQSHGKGGLLPLLHVEDSPVERLLVRGAIALTKTPFDFYEAGGLESAMPFFRVHSRNDERRYPQPAAVLLDYDLGTETGTDFLYWLRVLKRNESVPVVMFSGSAGKANVEGCYAAGADYFVSKPKSLERIKSVVRALYASITAPGQEPRALSLLPEFVADARIHRGRFGLVKLVSSFEEEAPGAKKRGGAFGGGDRYPKAPPGNLRG